MKRISIIIILLLSLCSCRQSNQIENSAVVVGAGLDTENGSIVLTVETVDTQNAKEGKTAGSVYTVTGETISEASANMSQKIGKPLYWDHLKLMVISEKFADTNMDMLFEWFLRSSHSRIATPIAVTTDSALKIFEIESKSFFISDILTMRLDTAYLLGFAPQAKAYLLYNRINGEGKTDILPLLHLKDEDVSVIGSSIFCNGRIAGHLTREQTKIALMLRGDLRGGEIDVGKASYTIKSASAKSLHTEGCLTRKINLRLALEQTDNINKTEACIKREIEEKLKTEAIQLIKTQQQNADILLLKDSAKEINTEFNIKIVSYGQSEFPGGKNE